MIPKMALPTSALLKCLRTGLAMLTLVSVGCGMGADAAGTSTAALSGLSPCDASLLHPRITVGATAVLPGKLIVYVDGVMACVDDTARVDQILAQVEGTAQPPQPALVAPDAPRR